MPLVMGYGDVIATQNKAYAIKRLCGIIERDSKDKIKKVFVPIEKDRESDSPRAAFVEIAVVPQKGIICRCHCGEIYGDGEPEPCKEAGKVICSHVFVAVMIRCDENNSRVYFYYDQAKANTFAKSKNGKVVTLQQGNVVCWLVIIPPINDEEEITEKKVEPQAISELCGRCKKNALLTPEEMESGLCPRCDRSVDLRSKD